MSNPYTEPGHTSETPIQTPVPAPKPKRRVSKKVLAYAGTAILAFGVGTVAGGGSDGTSTAPVSATPTPTVTVTESASPTSGAAPQSCLDALDAAEVVAGDSSQALSITGDLFGGPVQDAITAAAYGDVDGLQKANGELSAATDQLNSIDISSHVTTYNAAASKCRAAK